MKASNYVFPRDFVLDTFTGTETSTDWGATPESVEVTLKVKVYSITTFALPDFIELTLSLIGVTPASYTDNSFIKNDFYEYLSYRSPDDDCSMFLFKVKW